MNGPIRVPPARLPTKAVLFMNLGKGGFSRTYLNAEYQVRHFVWRENRRSPIECCFVIEGIDQEFPDYKSLREAVIEHNANLPPDAGDGSNSPAPKEDP